MNYILYIYIKTKYIYILYWLSFKANGHYNKHNIVFLLHRRNSNIASNDISGIGNRSYMFRFLPFGTFHQRLDILTGTVALRVERHVLGPLLLDQGDTHCANQSINTWGRFHQRKGNQSQLIKLTDWFAVLLGSGLLDVCLEISSQQRCLVDMFTMMSSFAQACL